MTIRTFITTLLVAFTVAGAAEREPTITTIAGTGAEAKGVLAGPLTTTPLEQPFGIAFDSAGRMIVCSYTAHVLYRVDLKKESVSTIAGSGKLGYDGDGGPATKAALNDPHEVQIDRAGNLYFTDMKNHAVRRVDAKTGVITTVAGTGKAGFSGDGGPADNAALNQPHSVALDSANSLLYIADLRNHRIRAVDLKTGVITTIAGNGSKKHPTEGQIAKGKPIYSPRALFVRDGVLWVALREGNSVWKLDPADGRLRHIAGTGKRGYTGDGGSPRDATFAGPKGLAVDDMGRIYVADTENHAIRVIDPASDRVWTLAGRGPKAKGDSGDGGPADQARLARPHGVTIGPDGRLYIGDSDNHRVRVVSPLR